MSKPAVQQLLNESFSLPAREDWLKVASAELNGADPFESLSWKNNDNIKFFPYYDKKDVSQFAYQINFDSTASARQFSGPAAWLNMPPIAVSEESSANQTALHYLSAGADGIFFDVRQKKSPDLVNLLQGIDWRYCSLSFYATSSFISTLHQYAKTNADSSGVEGTIFCDLPERKYFNFSHDLKKIKALGIVIKPSTTTKEISDALTSGVKTIDSIADENTLESVIRNVAFSIPVSSGFLENISKLKALRILWFQVAQAYGIKNYRPQDLHIHVRSEAWTNEQYQPHGNMLKNTTAAMASVIGGCDSISLYPENENNMMMNRIAQNVSSILREESHMDKVADPAAGSYVLRAMVDEIARHSWAMFQSNISR